MIREIKELIQGVRDNGDAPSRIYLPPDAYRKMQKHFDSQGKLFELTVVRCSESFNQILVR